ncbi:glycosyltransferase family 39 protein [Candidatus Roizmanbacteria bacterium]|nr:glycosyltransferase family 39 protein [Candidatus Roizmanbacteria bacterium]
MVKIINKVISSISHNIILTIIVIVYILATLSVITWGIPNPTHPFNYHMDEWHQMMAVKNTFKYGSPNVAGSAHGPMFQFFLTGVFLVPFVITGLIHPFAITSSVDPKSLLELEKLFIVLRLNTLIFGILSIILLYIIARKYLKINPILPTLLFTISPVWIALSNYFKYDIALMFWVLASLYGFLRYGEKPIRKNFFLAAVFCALAIATKISALPLLPLLILTYFLFTKNKHLPTIFWGIIIFIAVFVVTGMTDAFTQKAGYWEYFVDNLSTTPGTTSNFHLGMLPFFYIWGVIADLTFGRFIYPLFAVSLISWIIYLFIRFVKNKTKFIKTIADKQLVLLTASVLLFEISFIPLKLYANGNRLLIALPFFVLLVGLFYNLLVKKFNKTIALVIFIFIIVFQIKDTFYIQASKWEPDMRATSSQWIEKNIKYGTTIGIESIPIYQFLPDLIINEYYTLQKYPKYSAKYNYIIVDPSTKKLPEIIVLTRTELNEKWEINSPKKQLLKRIRGEHYQQVAEFTFPRPIFEIFSNELNIFSTSVIASSTITIFEKK